jgi:enolase
MEIRGVKALAILDSRKQKTIKVIIKTKKGKFKTSAPSGKSTGKFEAKPYYINLKQDIDFINKLPKEKLIIENFEDLDKIEKFINGKLGANSLFSLEASLLKALAKENKKELFEYLNPNAKKIPKPIGNTIGGGLHSIGINKEKPDFQEFLFISNCKRVKDCVILNKIAYNLTKKKIKSGKINDEGAIETNNPNEIVLEIMSKIRKYIQKESYEKIDIGIDCAASSFFNKKYDYKNPKRSIDKKQQIEYILRLIKKYDLFYIEDPLEENDFSGFKELKNKTNSLIVGDDLTTTNPERLKKAIKNKSINAIIIKPNQIGSLLKVREVIKIAKNNKIKTIISHRSGETKDNTIADLGVAFECDFIKTGIYGRVRESKLKRLIKIENKIRRKK